MYNKKAWLVDKLHFEKKDQIHDIFISYRPLIEQKSHKGEIFNIFFLLVYKYDKIDIRLEVCFFAIEAYVIF